MPADFVQIGVEGDLDEAVLKKILEHLGIAVMAVYGRNGKDDLRVNIKRYNSAARYGKWVILVDQNHEAECPPPLITTWLPTRNSNLQLRVAVREVESWLLADRSEIAHFLSVPMQSVPQQPETLDYPKQTMIALARRSKKRDIRTDLVPPEGSTSKQGPGYTSRLIEFALNRWKLERAATQAPSLKRSITTLAQWRHQ